MCTLGREEGAATVHDSRLLHAVSRISRGARCSLIVFVGEKPKGATAEEVVVGAYVQGEVAFSKVATAYTRRRKQGRAQLHFKRSNKGGGGGRSEGARLRARETVRLFAEGGEALASACELLPSGAPLFYAGDARVMEELCAGAAAAPPGVIASRQR